MKQLILLTILTVTVLGSKAQPISKDDYSRAVSFLWENVNNKKAYNLAIVPNWHADSTGFWFTHYVNGEKRYDNVLLKPLQRKPLFDHTKLAGKLSEALKEIIDVRSLPLENIRYINPTQFEFSAKGKPFKWNDATGDLSVNLSKEPERNPMESKSPDGKWIAYSQNYNLYIKSTTDGTIKQLSTRGAKNYEYASYYGWSDIIEGENGERPKRFVANWSPDSRYIQTSICDLRFGQKMYLLDWSVDTLYRARLLSYYRGSPGDTTVVHLVPVVFDINSGKETRLPMPRIAHEVDYGFVWLNEPGMAIVNYRDRGFHKANLLKVDVTKSTTQAPFTETSETNIDGFSWSLSTARDKLVVTSEKTGWKQLYAVDLKTAVVTPITNGSFFVNSVIEVDSKAGVVYFLGSGKEPGRNPYEQYVYRVGLDGKKLTLLTPELANHEISGSPDHLYFTDVYSTPQQASVSVLREAKSGKVIMELAKADVSGLSTMKWTPPQAFTALGKDGKSTIYGLLWKPTNFDPAKKYPIVDNSYTGPHGQIVPRTFARGINVNNQSLAELGFIVMMVDGLGTGMRSKEFHNHSYKRMGYNLEDHVRAIRQLSKQYAWIDTTRVGIFGHSAGGYDAGHAMMQYPDFYKVAVASSADHDFRMEKAWWPEMYMGWPVDSTYHQQSNITMAGNLKGKLLITHGGIDENVNPSATFKLAEMLVRADKQFDMLIFPSQKHGYTGPQQYYFTKRRWNYFVEHLRGEKPIWEFPWK
ncbi:MAG: prolyl oligopeptidase family serine peptidase [Cyclobacteriaceae bacterium]|nr:prolyl oligopeptidase family serine peptidase [Cyclobacteriaceae bacterium]